jgi:hypothetical protein
MFLLPKFSLKEKSITLKVMDTELMAQAENFGKKLASL